MAARSLLQVLLCSAIALPLFAADVAGKWQAETKRRDGEVMTMTYDFKVAGESLTGTITSPRGEREISEGKVNGDEIAFATKVEMQGETRKLLYKGKVDGDELKLTMSSENGEFSRDFVAKRVK
jgi:hypothetical protein